MRQDTLARYSLKQAVTWQSAIDTPENGEALNDASHVSPVRQFATPATAARRPARCQRSTDRGWWRQNRRDQPQRTENCMRPLSSSHLGACAEMLSQRVRFHAFHGDSVRQTLQEVADNKARTRWRVDDPESIYAMALCATPSKIHHREWHRKVESAQVLQAAYNSCPA